MTTMQKEIKELEKKYNNLNARLIQLKAVVRGLVAAATDVDLDPREKWIVGEYGGRLLQSNKRRRRSRFKMGKGKKKSRRRKCKSKRRSRSRKRRSRRR